MPRDNRKMMEICLPFAGFYESMWSAMVDYQETQWVEHEAENAQAKYGVPEELRIPADDLHDMLFYATDYSTAYLSIAQGYALALLAECGKAFGFAMQGEWSTMVSPRQYNFGTDRIFVKVPPRAVRKMFDISKRRDNHATLSTLIAERFTSRSGFTSFYSNELQDWLDKPLVAWDHNETGMLLLTCIRLHESELNNETCDGHDTEDRLEWAVYENWADSGHQEWSAAVDWPKMAAAMQAWRDEKKASLEAERVPYTKSTLGTLKVEG